jgi:TfuA protein
VPGYDPDRILVFAGPTLHGRSLAAPFVQRPPAVAGDLLRLLSERPCTILLIDGCFDERPSVWHKEILFLLARGFRVIGASSMGALRAAELSSFGMIGVGAIFAAYAGARLVGDDEVALAHAEAEHGFKPVSVPQVNVRATLGPACRAGLLSVADARALRALSAGIHYRDRVWPTILDAGRAAGLSVEAFARGLPGLIVDLKRLDAEQALDLAHATSSAPPAPAPEPPRTPYFVRAAQLLGVDLSGSAERG